MKVRLGFVSNSSSASFIVDKRAITEAQAELLRQHSTIAVMLYNELKTEVFSSGNTDGWNLEETKNTLNFDTTMDNFDLPGFAKEIGVPNKAIIENSREG